MVRTSFLYPMDPESAPARKAQVDARQRRPVGLIWAISSIDIVATRAIRSGVNHGIEERA
jgi:hypothetical protein